jgi:hypothetical protein
MSALEVQLRQEDGEGGNGDGKSGHLCSGAKVFSVDVYCN